jgi:hypothetical protein
MSGATARQPAFAAAAIWCFQEYQDSGQPWQKRSSGPLPCSATRIVMPLTCSEWSFGSFIGSSGSGAGRGRPRPAC